MLFLSVAIMLAICIQGSIFYKKLQKAEGELITEEEEELSIFARVTAYSVTTFRLVYGFDYG